MAFTAFATKTQLDTWVPEGMQVPDNADQLLRSATFVIAAPTAANRNPYGDPPSGGDAGVLADATCAQVTSWLTLGVTPGGLGIGSAPVKKSSILDADVERDTSGQTAMLKTATEELCAEARDILLAAGLLWLPTALGDEAPYLLSYGLTSPRAYCWPELAEWPYLWL